MNDGGKEEASSDQFPAMGDAKTISKRPDGRFDVTCNDGRTEIHTEQELLANQVCLALPPTVDPFDPASCAGPSMTRPEAIALIPPGNTESPDLGDYKLYIRKRRCSALTGCSPWRTPPEEAQSGNLASAKYSPVPYIGEGYDSTYYNVLREGKFRISAANGEIHFLYRGLVYSTNTVYTGSCRLPADGEVTRCRTSSMWGSDHLVRFAGNTLESMSDAHLTTTCFRDAFSGRYTDQADSSFWFELEGVIFGAL
ncbi:hypothetical protein LZC95_17285 [Pendulispora brunnea]|uniref:Uncharacterized protein n=1 Tax=Pendulispora brunnea TaxID=2905690 RepID=A0ABZ2KLN6_9BACT